MLISHPKKFIFIHVYKVAGTSIRSALKNYSHINFRSSSLNDKINFLFGNYPKIFSDQFDGHISANELRKLIPESIFNSYFKFSFVRNPWDWQVSLYSFALKDKNHHHHQLIKSFKSFDQYIEWRVNEDLHLQKEYITDNNGNLLLDFIGKYETINEDFKKICEILNISTTLPHANKSFHKNYKEYYNENTKNMIAKYYKDDIDLFNYDF